ncbi:aspartyl-phosphate phosphatase Spo0E family protein [Ammoniphilus oxalaticus]|uniref:aspartyl-phosphate phosphatase Spo0E family protein n=1 Tax=Ammoniphilus oxalaticus TaxID=66863 RepID=UPI000E75D2DB|nr:aspartyl-phosphate phosphatase Spo0E family protein [Ammoniphilus oxalaticus]
MAKLRHIEQVRGELHVLASGRGYPDGEVLKKSQELDRLIVEYMKNQAVCGRD